MPIFTGINEWRGPGGAESEEASELGLWRKDVQNRGIDKCKGLEKG